MSILCKDVSVELGGKRIVDKINAEFETGKFIGIIGPNGSGKSTLLKSIYRTLSISEGDIYIDEKLLSEYPYKESAKAMSVVAQHSDYSFEFSCLEVVLMGRSPYKKYMQSEDENDYNIAFDALDKVDMLEYKNRQFSTLSGGEQQRIILARALCQQTRYLILDEPTNHLDVKHQLDILDLVKSIGVTVIAAIHDLNIALRYCDYIYVLKSGKIYYEGNPQRVLTPKIIQEIYDVKCNILNDDKADNKVISFYTDKLST